MRKFTCVAVGALLLAGCSGGAEDFTVEVNRPPVAVVLPLLDIDIAEARSAFPGIKVIRSRPNDSEIVYTIPSEGNADAVIRLRLEPLRDGNATLIHASVDTPATSAVVGGITKVLSETKVEHELEKLLRQTGKNLEQRSSTHADTQKLSGLMLAVAISVSKNFVRVAQDLKDHPERLAAATWDLSDDSTTESERESARSDRQLSEADRADDARRREADATYEERNEDTAERVEQHNAARENGGV
jgi:hypothetical protein